MSVADTSFKSLVYNVMVGYSPVWQSEICQEEEGALMSVPASDGTGEGGGGTTHLVEVAPVVEGVPHGDALVEV